MEAQLAQAQKRIHELESELREARSASPYGSQSASSPGALYSDSEQDHALYAQVGLDARGSITYHGHTSQYQEATLEEEHEDQTEDALVVRERLREACQRDFKTSHEYVQNVWQPSLHLKTEADFGIPADIANHLLSTYFAWQNPVINFVYKPLFIKDLALGGRYSSRFLLACIFALAARHCDHQSPVYLGRGDQFLTVAKELLVSELSSPRPAVATIQGLLVLGYRQFGIGHTSEGWLFSGMAFRMMTDIGGLLDPQRLSRYESLGSLEIEGRKRLGVSAHYWDKLLSLTLGRPSTLPNLGFSVDDIFDECDDREYWHPLDCANPNGYRATRSYNTTSLKHLSGLCDLISPLLATTTGRGRSGVADGQIESVQDRLEFWFDQLPTVIRIDDPRQRTAAPPPHILSVNLLYRTLLLILNRHYQHDTLRSLSAMQIHKLHYLEEQAALLHELLILYCRTFQYKAHTYLVGYCVYTAATIDIGFIRFGNEEQRHVAALRLRAALKILAAESEHTLGLKKSVESIQQQIKNATTEREQRSSRSSEQPPSFDQAFATAGPSSRLHDSTSLETSAFQNLNTFVQGVPAQYFPPYLSVGGQSATTITPYGASQGQDVVGTYNSAIFGWDYTQYPRQDNTGNAPMYDWPATSHA